MNLWPELEDHAPVLWPLWTEAAAPAEILPEGEPTTPRQPPPKWWAWLIALLAAALAWAALS